MCQCAISQIPGGYQEQYRQRADKERTNNLWCYIGFLRQVSSVDTKPHQTLQQILISERKMKNLTKLHFSERNVVVIASNFHNFQLRLRQSPT